MDFKLHDKSSPEKSTCALECTKNVYVHLSLVTSTRIYLVHLGLIFGIGKLESSIPRMKVACHNSYKVSMADLYIIYGVK